MLHALFGTHVPDPGGNHWENGLFVSECRICGQAMVKPPTGEWRIVQTNTRTGKF